MNIKSIFVSAVCHFLFFSLVTFVSVHSFKNKPVLDFIDVDLVEIPAPPAPVASPVKPPVNSVTDIEKKKIPAKKEEPVKEKKAERKEYIKAKEANDIKPVKKVEETETRKVAELIKSIEKKMAEKKDKITDVQEKPKEEIKKYRRDFINDIITNYQAEIAYRIRKNWVFPDQVAETPNLEAILVINILKDGKIEKIWFEKNSGNAYLDESAYKAIMKSNPLPPLPEEIGLNSYSIGFTFTPLGLN